MKPCWKWCLIICAFWSKKFVLISFFSLWLIYFSLRFVFFSLRFALFSLRFALISLRFALFSLRFALFSLRFIFALQNWDSQFCLNFEKKVRFVRFASLYWSLRFAFWAKKFFLILKFFCANFQQIVNNSSKF